MLVLTNLCAVFFLVSKSLVAYCTKAKYVVPIHVFPTINVCVLCPVSCETVKGRRALLIDLYLTYYDDVFESFMIPLSKNAVPLVISWYERY